MIVLRAAAMGMCFGVRDALALVQSIGNPNDVTIYGELVHNEEVNRNLAARGFQTLTEADRRNAVQTPSVLITAHGISDRERRALELSGKSLIDTTCPLVKRVHETAQRLHTEGWFILVAGKANHVEVLGITGDLERYAVIESEDNLPPMDAPRIAIVCQTTLQPERAKNIFSAVQAAHPQSDVRLFDTICRPTRERQEAALSLLKQVDALVVVGGRHSNNTLHLVKLAADRNIPVRHIQSATELDASWFAGFQRIGLTAGTSTPEAVIESVYQTLQTFNTAPKPATQQFQTH